MSSITDLLNKATIKDLCDGTSQNEPLQTVSDNRCGAYARVTRPEQTITHYACAGVENNYYPGNMILVDEQFLTKDPTIIPFREEERKPLNYSLSSGAYIPITEDPFKEVVPTERNVNAARNRFAYLYGRDCAEKHRKMGNDVDVDEKIYNSGASLNVGGTIKGVDFSVGGSFDNYRTKVFVLKQRLYTVSLDNTYKNGDDFFTDKLNLDELANATSRVRTVLARKPKSRTYTLQRKLRTLPLGIIQEVNYGRMAIITVSSKDQSSLSAKIADYCKLELKGGKGKCDVKIRIVGGTIAGFADGAEVSGEDAANKIISYLYTHQIAAEDIETAKPIEYTVSYLKDMKKLVTTKILPYSQVYVERVGIRVYDNNSGESYTVYFKCLDVKPNKEGKPDYTLVGETKKLDFNDFKFFVSPRALCLQFQVVGVGVNSKYDRNIYCPRIPLEKMEPEDDGQWYFRLYMTGTNYWSTKYSFSPEVEWRSCKYNKLMSDNGVLSRESYYVGKTEGEILQQYESWCEW